MQEEPDFLYKMVNAWFSPGASYIHHPLVSGLVIFFPLIRGNVPEKQKQALRGMAALASENMCCEHVFRRLKEEELNTSQAAKQDR